MIGRRAGGTVEVGAETAYEILVTNQGTDFANNISLRLDVPEGMVVPPGSMVMGVPGKVRRTLTPEEDASIKWYADNYVRYRLDFVTESAPTPA